MSKVNPVVVNELAAFLESLSHLPLADRVLLLVRELKVRGNADAYARPAMYLAEATSSSTTANVYKLSLSREESRFVVVQIEHPADGTADIICSSLRANGVDYVHSDVIMDPWCDSESSEDARGLPWPIVVGGQDVMSIVVSGSSLNVTGLSLRGFHVDELTAAVLRQVGELFVEGFNKTYSAAALMSEQVPRKFTQDKEFTHLVSKQTLTGDAARDAISISFKTVKLMPKDGNAAKVIPPLSWRKPGARVSIGVGNGDTAVVSSRYTSAGAAGTAKLQVTGLGRSRVRGC